MTRTSSRMVRLVVVVITVELLSSAQAWRRRWRIQRRILVIAG